MRARLLKPGFFKIEELADVPAHGRLLFAGLWTLADRDGRLEDRPARIRVEVFPYEDHVDVERLLAILADRGFVVRYTVGGRRYLWIPTFLEHQRPHFRESASQLPAAPPVQPRLCFADGQAQPRSCLDQGQAQPRSPVMDPVYGDGEDPVSDPVSDPEAVPRAADEELVAIIRQADALGQLDGSEDEAIDTVQSYANARDHAVTRKTATLALRATLKHGRP